MFESPRFEILDVDPSPTGSTEDIPLPVPKQELLEVEMTRLVFSHHLSKAIKTARETLAAADAAANPPVVSSEVLCDQAVISKAVDVQQLVSAVYQCDFGNVVAGSSKKKMFKVTNSSTAGVMSWNFDNIGTECFIVF